MLQLLQILLTKISFGTVENGPSRISVTAIPVCHAAQKGPSTLNYIELACASWNKNQDIWGPPIHSNCSSKLAEKSVTFRQRASRISRAIDTLRSQLSCALPQGALCDDLRRAECAYHSRFAIGYHDEINPLKNNLHSDILSPFFRRLETSVLNSFWW